MATSARGAGTGAEAGAGVISTVTRTVCDGCASAAAVAADVAADVAACASAAALGMGGEMLTGGNTATPTAGSICACLEPTEAREAAHAAPECDRPS